MLTVDFSRLEIKPGDRILDIGCGPGRHACEAVKRSGVSVTAADLDAGELIKARENLNYCADLGECRGTWAAAAADITRLPFGDATFDVIVCAETLEHIDQHQKAAAELFRVLKPGKNLVVSVPRNWPERICWKLSSDYHNANAGHVRIYVQAGLKRLLRRAGFALWGKHYAHSLHSPYWWIKCLVGPTREDSRLVNLYHRFLVWDMFKRPAAVRLLARILNPLMGKSLVLYFQKGKCR